MEEIKKDFFEKTESAEKKEVAKNAEKEIKKTKKKKDDKKIKEEDTSKSNVYKVAVTLLNVRKGPGYDFDNIKFVEFPEAIRIEIFNQTHKNRDAIVKGMKFEVFETKDNWGRIDLGWINLDYCEKQGE